MTAYIQGKTRSGKKWTPSFIESLNEESCMGCGRCYKVCGRSAFSFRMFDEDEEDDDDDSRAGVMEIVDGENCIGCEACAKVCVKKCHTFSPVGIS